MKFRYRVQMLLPFGVNSVCMGLGRVKIQRTQGIKESVGCFSQTQMSRSKRWGIRPSSLPPCVLSMSWKGFGSSRATGKAAEAC